MQFIKTWCRQVWYFQDRKKKSLMAARQNKSFTSAKDEPVSSIWNKQPNPIRKGNCTHGMWWYQVQTRVGTLNIYFTHIKYFKTHTHTSLFRENPPVQFKLNPLWCTFWFESPLAVLQIFHTEVWDTFLSVRFNTARNITFLFENTFPYFSMECEIFGVILKNYIENDTSLTSVI